MYVGNETGELFQYYCDKCRIKREGLLNSSMYSWNCPRCGNSGSVEEVCLTTNQYYTVRYNTM